MTAKTDTRKRIREEDCSDSMPLSKRINNLHINNNIPDFSMNHNNLMNGNESQDVLHMSDEQRNAQELSEASRENFFVSSIENRQSQLEPENLTHYSPELSQHDNPYYYNKNKLLYELHLERLRRTHQP